MIDFGIVFVVKDYDLSTFKKKNIKITLIHLLITGVFV